MLGRRDHGFALVTAVIAVAAFGFIAFAVLAATRGAVAISSARAEQAKLAAAADAGINLAIYFLAADDRGVRWSADGRRHTLLFDDVELAVTIEDERGKAPLAGLNDDQARALFAGAGVTGDRLDALVTEFRDWQSDASSDSSAGSSDPSVYPVRHGPFRTVGELAGLKDMDPTVFARIAPAVTVFFEDTGPFDPSHAPPLAQAAMKADSLANPEQLDNQSQTADERPDEELADNQVLYGRPMTIRVVARGRDGAHTHRMEIVEFTGDRTNPFWIRYTE